MLIQTPPSTKQYKIPRIKQTPKNFNNESELTIVDEYERNLNLQSHYSKLVEKKLKSRSKTTPASPHSLFPKISLSPPSTQNLHRNHSTRSKRQKTPSSQFSKANTNLNINTNITKSPHTPADQYADFTIHVDSIQDQHTHSYAQKAYPNMPVVGIGGIGGLKGSRKISSSNQGFIPTSPLLPTFDQLSNCDDTHSSTVSFSSDSDSRDSFSGPHSPSDNVRTRGNAAGRGKGKGQKRFKLYDPTEGKVRLKHLEVLKHMRKIGIDTRDFMLDPNQKTKRYPTFKVRLFAFLESMFFFFRKEEG
jgi:hypothetical protein